MFPISTHQLECSGKGYFLRGKLLNESDKWFLEVTFPLGLSPSAMQQLAHPEGELATSRAAATMGLSMCLSSYSNTSLEDVKLQGKDNPYMIQMCVVKDRNVTKQLLQRAEGES